MSARSLYTQIVSIQDAARRDRQRILAEYQLSPDVPLPPAHIQALMQKHTPLLDQLLTQIKAELDAEVKQAEANVSAARKQDAASPDRLRYYQAVTAFTALASQADPGTLAKQLQTMLSDDNAIEAAALAAGIRARYGDQVPGVLSRLVDEADQALKSDALVRAEAALEAAKNAQTMFAATQRFHHNNLRDTIEGRMTVTAETFPAVSFVFGS